MENATITELENGLFKIVPDEGFMLRNLHNCVFYKEAYTYDVSEYEVVEV